MTYYCPAKRECGIYCKNKVAIKGDWCRHHQHLKPQTEKCKCLLDNGSDCPYSAGPNGFCEFHIEPKQCQGKVLLGGLCLRYIPTGQYCSSCKRQLDIIQEGLKEKASAVRTMLSENGPLVPSEKSAFYVPHLSELQIEITVPDFLKKVELEKPETCGICLEPMEGKIGDSYRQLTCGHYFHLDCISKVNKMQCPMDRSAIVESCLPKWAVSRIRENISNYEAEKQEEQTRATQHVIRQLVQDELLDLGSSEEDEMTNHINNGARMTFQTVRDNTGQNRMAVVFTYGTSP